MLTHISESPAYGWTFMLFPFSYFFFQYWGLNPGLVQARQALDPGELCHTLFYYFLFCDTILPLFFFLFVLLLEIVSCCVQPRLALNLESFYFNNWALCVPFHLHSSFTTTSVTLSVPEVSFCIQSLTKLDIRRLERYFTTSIIIYSKIKVGHGSICLFSYVLGPVRWFSG